MIRYLFVYIILSYCILLSCSSARHTVVPCDDSQNLYYCADTMLHTADRGHIDTLYEHMPDDLYYDMEDFIYFPIVYKVLMQSPPSQQVSENEIISATDNLNLAFQPAGIQFKIKSILVMEDSPNLQDITADYYALYASFSLATDEANAITVYLADDNGK